ncbi:MAG: pantetheine-phosphate adenylyltransferase [Magnetospiraceae bacterium]
MTERLGVYPGTFDPVTKGHLDIIQRASHLLDRLIVGVAFNPGKGPLFTVEERVDMLRKDTAGLKLAHPMVIEIVPFDNLLMHFVEENNANVIIRGLRAVSDFEYEFQMAGMNAHLNDDVETVFLMASDRYQLIASRMVREIAKYGGDITQFVTPATNQRMIERFSTLEPAD